MIGAPVTFLLHCSIFGQPLKQTKTDLISFLCNNFIVISLKKYFKILEKRFLEFCSTFTYPSAQSFVGKFKIFCKLETLDAHSACYHMFCCELKPVF